MSYGLDLVYVHFAGEAKKVHIRVFGKKKKKKTILEYKYFFQK